MKVQTTNDFSCVSKLSSARKGYFNDEFLQFFVQEQKIRAPIINRGYYVRFKAMEQVLKSWFLQIKSKAVEANQIISLGAGFDTTYFRLRKHNELLTGTKYIEVDFPEVMIKKLECIKKSELKDFSECSKDSSAIVATSKDYIMLGANLNDLEELNRCFEAIWINYSIPTLFISECSVIYMDTNSSNDLLSWIQKRFSHSAFCAYEQVYPWDAFGIVMQRHFESQGCPLISLLKYPDENQRKSRFTDMGWQSCYIVDMYRFFLSLPLDEKRRIQSLELFDEYEIWHEKCQHYAIIWAFQGQISHPQLFPKDQEDYLLEKIPLQNFSWNMQESDSKLHRYGHRIVQSSLSSSCIISGGFGCHNERQQRLGGLDLCDLETGQVRNMNISDPDDFLGKRMFHTMTRLSDGEIVIIGGRSCPRKVYNKVVSVLFNDGDLLEPSKILATVKLRCMLPFLVWRHSASSVNINGVECIIVFGGCTIEGNVTNKCFILNTKSWSWSEVAVQNNTPSPRHSHSSVSFDNSKVVIIGGLSEDETILNSVHILDCETNQWSVVTVSGLLPRYSHTSHIWKNNIFLIGGITCDSGSSLGLGIINLTTLKASEFSYPEQNPEKVVVLNNHSSILYGDMLIITGGGGNYFSFGTHFNHFLLYIDIKSLKCDDLAE
ncbi:tRNA wybutosine-synthesizing protein 4-like [Uloborus diversus]|uniref:tRNA wybutosine-synthesizing protein 4-like n=1 Tax=Uloborus diversus TaxID=327109 RepID=UPI002409C7C1|nr:tRNA wybutosine-synthesizing protein 4-like [Uloborus diversus]